MADNLTLPATGAILRTQDNGGVHTQVGKLGFSPAGVAPTHASTTDPFPVGFPVAATNIDTTTVLLAASATYTGIAFDATSAGTYLTCHVFADVSGTLEVQQSVDNVTWDTVYSLFVPAATASTAHHVSSARYQRARFLNGATVQATFRMQTLCKHTGQQLNPADPLWDSVATIVGTVGVATSLVIPAPAVGHVIVLTGLTVTKLYNAAGTAAGAGVTITTLNLFGLAFTTEQIGAAIGTAVNVVDMKLARPLRSQYTANATTIQCPAQAQTIWRITATYFVAPNIP